MPAPAMPSAHQVARAAVVAGVLSGVPSTLHALVTGGDVLAATRAAGTLLPGRRDRPGLLAGVVAHAVITVAWVAVLAAASRRRPLGPWRGRAGGRRHRRHRPSRVVAPIRAPAIAALPQPPQWADHLAFGALVGACLAE